VLRFEPVECVAFLARQSLDRDDVRLERREARQQRFEQRGVELVRQLREMGGSEHQHVGGLSGDLHPVRSRIERGHRGCKRLGGDKGKDRSGHRISSLMCII